MTENRSKIFSSWVYLAFALVGLLIGLLAGMSLSPVVGTLLPLLFSIIGGGIGFFATSKPEYSRQIGISIVLLASLCLVGTIYGIRLRQGLAWRCFFFTCGDEMSRANLKFQIPTNITNVDDYFALVSIKSTLQVTDLDPKDKERLFQMAIENANLKDGRFSKLSGLDDQLREMALFHKTMTVPGQPATESEHPHVKK